VRELLSRYFDVCRGPIERCGGTVEKVIGDAVIAVWGARSSGAPTSAPRAGTAARKVG
jgi:class 3 adenylate cyclase